MFTRRRQTFSLPKGHRVYAIGDIHGQLPQLRDLLAMIEEDQASSGSGLSHSLVFLGDYIDRGPESAGVISRLLELQEGPQDCCFLKGNHEAFALAALEGKDCAAWFSNGGDETCASYGLSLFDLKPDPEAGLEIGERLRQKMPGNHIAFISNLELSRQLGDYLFVHAGVQPEIPLDQQKERDLLWIREPFLSWKKPLDLCVVHGHTPRSEPEERRHRIGIDTGACYGGPLTALVLEGPERRFLQAH